MDVTPEADSKPSSPGSPHYWSVLSLVFGALALIAAIGQVSIAGPPILGPTATQLFARYAGWGFLVAGPLALGALVFAVLGIARREGVRAIVGLVLGSTAALLFVVSIVFMFATGAGAD